ncbi:thioredoxin family protein [Flammeovirga sp. MY04]|uniref:thioredoxin family protein n=1 Tax=Flammeovirga sp. MY04 TaxID=1191459 RepID=UPI0008062C4D|nr:thioredoxin family protein [Flammeovirga sp. MY04]ANQ52681.1 thioredoxin family protein [Flammeovirga sp. MY04]
MKKLIISLFVFFGFTISILAQENKEIPAITDPVTKAGWTNDANYAIKTAQDEKRPIIMDFTGSDWCGWCKKIDREIFDTPEFKKWVKENNIILLELDFPKGVKQSDQLRAQNYYLAQEYKIQGYPTIFIVKDGKGIQMGYQKGGPEAWIKAVEAQLDI